jgi:hypothetical protein
MDFSKTVSMKIFAIFIFMFCTHLKSFSQKSNVIVDTSFQSEIYTPYFEKFSNNFKWNNFSFKSELKNYINDLVEVNDDTAYVDLYLPKNELSNRYVFKFNKSAVIQNINFKDVFLTFGSYGTIDYGNNFYQSIAFVNYYKNNDEVKRYYKKYIDTLTKKFGKPGEYFTDHLEGYDNGWFGKEFTFRLFVDTSKKSIVFTNVYITNVYDKSLKYKYDYFYTSEKFKTIDSSNTFRGIKFGTDINSIKSIARLKSLFSDYSFNVEEDKYLVWNSILFSSTIFYFSKEKKLSSVLLLIDNSNEDSYNDLRKELIEILGFETIVGDFIMWEGKNLKVAMDKNYNPIPKSIFVVIESKLFQRFTDVDY